MSDQERIAQLEDTVWHLRKENRFAEAEGYSQSLKRIKELEERVERLNAVIGDMSNLPAPKAYNRAIDKVLALNSLKEWDDVIPPRIVVDKIRRDIERLRELT